MGSELIGQDFSGGAWFESRPSATTPVYNAAASAASNLSTDNPVFKSEVTERLKALQTREGRSDTPPAELLTASASGIDPHISVEAALWQVGRIARQTGISPDKLTEMIDECAQMSLFGGSRYVNVLELNLRLKAQISKTRPNPH